MSKEEKIINDAINSEYKYGFTTNIEQEIFPPGLNEDVITSISKNKNEPNWLLNWRLSAYNVWLKMKEPNWSKVKYPHIDYQKISYFASPKKKKI